MNNMQINKLMIAIKDSPEYKNIMQKKEALKNSTQLEEIIKEDYFGEVAEISSRFIEKLEDNGFKKDEKGNIINHKFAELIGLCHDLGYIIYDNIGERALNNCLNKVRVTDKYLKNRRENYGDKYEDEQEKKYYNIKQKDSKYIRTMEFNQNEHSVEVLLNICERNNIKREDIKDLIDGVLSYNTSKVEKNPNLVEQQAVRLADKVAYINRDIDKLLKNNIVKINELPKSIKEFMKLTSEERIESCTEEILMEYKKEKEITGGSEKLKEIKKEKINILNIEKNYILNSDEKDEIINDLINSMSENEKKQLDKKWKAYGRENEIEDILIKVKDEKKYIILKKYNEDIAEKVNDKEEKIITMKKELLNKFPNISKFYIIKNINDNIFYNINIEDIEKGEDLISKIQNKIDALYNYYLLNSEEMKMDDEILYNKEYTQEEKVAFYISKLNNEKLEEKYNEINKNIIDKDNVYKNNFKINIGIEKGEVMPTNNILLENINKYINYDENNKYNDKSKEKLYSIDSIKNIAESRRITNINNTSKEILQNAKEREKINKIKELER